MPVYSSHLLSYEQLGIGDRIRLARQRRGMTLKQLASRADSSAARLSQVENDRVWLDFEELLALAAILDLPLDDLIPTDVPVPYQIVRDGTAGAHSWRPALLRAADVQPVLTLRHSFHPLAELFVRRNSAKRGTIDARVGRCRRR